MARVSPGGLDDIKRPSQQIGIARQFQLVPRNSRAVFGAVQRVGFQDFAGCDAPHRLRGPKIKFYRRVRRRIFHHTRSRFLRANAADAPSDTMLAVAATATMNVARGTPTSSTQSPTKSRKVICPPPRPAALRSIPHLLAFLRPGSPNCTITYFGNCLIGWRNTIPRTHAGKPPQIQVALRAAAHDCSEINRLSDKIPGLCGNE